MDNTFLANVQREGQIKTDETAGEHEEEKEKQPPASPTEKQPEDKTAPPAEPKKEGEPSEVKEGEEPAVFQAFHKHPRWISAQQELKELRDFKERTEPLLDKFGESEKREEKSEIPEWFIDVFGENREAWNKYRAYNVAERKALREEILNEIQDVSQKQVEETKKWDKWVETELENIIGDDEIAGRAKAIGFDLSNKEQAKSFRNELFKVAVDYQPSDEDNNISLSKAFEILELRKLKTAPEKKLADKKKEIADKTMGKGEVEGQKNFKTSYDLAGKSFRDLVSE